MNRSQLNSFRATAGLGQGAVRNANARSNDKMGGYNSFEQAPTYEGGGMQMSPQEMMVDDRNGVMGNAPVVPQFNGPQAGLQGMRGGGMGQPSAYSQQLNRFVGAGGQMANFKPRMGAVGPQYRNGIVPRQQLPSTGTIAPYGNGPNDGSIELPKPILPTWG